MTFRALVIVLVTSMFLFALLRDASEQSLELSSFRVIADKTGALEFEAALGQLAVAPTVLRKSTERATTPFWLWIPVKSSSGDDVVVFGDKQISSLEVWLIDDGGQAIVAGTYRRADALQPGFDRTSNSVSFALSNDGKRYRAVVARVTSQASSTLFVQRGSWSDYQHFKLASERSAAVLAGGLALLAMFSALVSYFSGTGLFITFGIWLVASIAVCATFLGYDYLWFGQWTTPEYEVRAKLFILAFHAFSTTQLFLQLFRRGLAQVGMLRYIRRLAATSVAFAAAAFFVPAEYFLPAYWLFAAVAFGASAVAILKVTMRGHGVTIHWYAAGWGVQIVAGLAEVLYATGVVPRIPGISSESGVLIAGLLTGIAVADTLREERVRRQGAQKSAAAAAAQYRKVYDTVPVGMLTVSSDGIITRANKTMTAYCQRLENLGPEESCPLSAIVGSERALALLDAYGSTKKVSLELRFDQSSGEGRTFAVDAVGSIDGVEITFNDVTASTKLRDTLQYLSQHDPLTGLANRRGIEHEFPKMQQLLRKGVAVSVAYLDLDRFKLVNEFYGHSVGDRILVEVAQRMRASTPPAAFLGRIGGDEFLVCLPGYAQNEAHSIVAGVLDRLLNQTYEVDGKALSISGSAGIIQVSEEMSLTDVLAFADRACAVAKTKGKAMVADVAYTNDVIKEYRSRVELGNTMRNKFPADRLRLYAQPIVRLGDRDAQSRYEILLRVLDDRSELVHPPGKLLSIAEQQGLMADVDRFVLQGTLTHLSENAHHTRGLEFAAVNLSAMSLNDERFVADAIAMLSEHISVARHVMLEITESVALFDISGTRRFVDQMRSLGARIALDDFGAGYTSFSYLKNFPASLVKIDGGFIRDLNNHPANYAITRAITSLCHELKIQCLAEWVEDGPTLLGLLELDVDYAQGYLFSQAQPLDHWLTNKVDLGPLQAATAIFRRQAPLRVRSPYQ